MSATPVPLGGFNLSFTFSTPLPGRAAVFHFVAAIKAPLNLIRQILC
jgi:hypothetical protein